MRRKRNAPMDNAVLHRRGTGYAEVYEYEFSELESACCLMDAKQLPCPLQECCTHIGSRQLPDRKIVI